MNKAVEEDTSWLRIQPFCDTYKMDFRENGLHSVPLVWLSFIPQPEHCSDSSRGNRLTVIVLSLKMTRGLDRFGAEKKAKNCLKS